MYWCTYPTVGQMLLDVLAIPTSSMEVEALFSCGKQVSTEHCSHLGTETFHELQILDRHIRLMLVNFACMNEDIVEEVFMCKFEVLCQDESVDSLEFDSDLE